MTKLLLISLLFNSMCAYSQENDTSAELDLGYENIQFTITPDKAIWMVGHQGLIYSTANIRAEWVVDSSIYIKSDFSASNGRRDLKTISFLNPDSAIITGNIYEKTNELFLTGYFTTKDGGKNWEEVYHPFGSYIYTNHTNFSNYLWMGGDGRIMFSSDFGKTWTVSEILVPNKRMNRVSSISMSTPNNGLASTLEGGLIITNDNWSTSKYIETPYDQGKCKLQTGYERIDQRITKSSVWKNYYIVLQNKQLFYSHADSLIWQSFNRKVVSFDVDHLNQTLVALTDSLEVICLNNPREINWINQINTEGNPLDIKSNAGYSYILTSPFNIFEVQNEHIARSYNYLSDYKIKPPKIIRTSPNRIFGINSRKFGDIKTQVYTYWPDVGWIRLSALKIPTEDFNIIDDNTLKLWDGSGQNYFYHVDEDSLQKVQLNQPLSEFTTQSITKVILYHKLEGCNLHRTATLNYGFNGNKELESSYYLSSFDDTTQKPVNLALDPQDLLEILIEINRNPYELPELNEFKLSKKDYKNYFRELDLIIAGKKGKYLQQRIIENEKFYYQFPKYVKNSNSLPILHEFLAKKDKSPNFSLEQFRVTVINEKNDTLIITNSNEIGSLPWGLPWQIEFKKSYFNCYSLNLAKFIKNSLPDNFPIQHIFDNSYFLMDLANFTIREDIELVHYITSK